MKSSLSPFIQNDENSAAYWMFDILWVIKAHAAQTNGAFSLIEQEMPFNSGPPPHCHKEMDEIFYILEGEMILWAGGEIHKLTAGTLAMIPRETPHYFKISSTKPCRALNMYTPGGFETGIVRNAQKAGGLYLPPDGLPYLGSTDKNDMHTALDIIPLDLIQLASEM